MSSPRLSRFLLAIALLLPALSAVAANAQKQATLRISVTLVDGCDIRLPTDPEAAGQDSRIECSDDLPHHFALQPPARPSTVRAVPGDGQPPLQEDARAAPVPDAFPAPATDDGEVTVAVVTF